MRWVVKVGGRYLETEVWLLLGDAQRSAIKFASRKSALHYAGICATYSDYAKQNVRVVRLRSRTAPQVGEVKP